MRNRSRFFAVVIAVLALVYTYMVWRLLPDAGVGLKVLFAVPFALVWVMPAIVWSLDNEPPAWILYPLQWLAFLSMGWLSFAWVLTVARDVFLIPARHWLGWTEPFTPQGNVMVMLLAVLAVAYGAVRALTPPGVHEVEVPITGLPAALSGFRIAQLTDLHVGSAIGRRFVTQVAARVNAARPDMVALTGDFGDGEPESLRSGISPLADLKTRHGVYYVLGNHECYWNAEGWTVLMKSIGAKVLLNEGQGFDHDGARVFIGGVVDPATPMWRADLKPDAAAAAQGGSGADFRILLAHQPGISAEAEAAGFDLQLSGHTHAGQFFPWTLIARKVHPILVGLKRWGKMWVYVSPGTGTWGPPVRVGTTTEITLLRLVSA